MSSKTVNRRIELDNPKAKKIGFTSDKFDGYLWEHGQHIWISFIISKRPGKGNVQNLFDTIESTGYKVIVPTPSDKMKSLCIKRGMRSYRLAKMGIDVMMTDYKKRDQPVKYEIEKFRNTYIAFDPVRQMVNATDMLKSFPNKRMSDYLRLKQTKVLQEALESKTGIPVLMVKHGGKNNGTWMNKLMALDFAAWLSVDFRIFVYETFENAINKKLAEQQKQLDYFWDKEDRADLYLK